MKIVIVGAGPAGLYCGLLLKKADLAHDITIVERNPADATYGWGVVFSDRTLAAFREADYKTYKEITDRFVIWDAIDVRFRGELMRCGGHVFAGIPRKVLLGILQRRCAELGVALRFETEIGELAQVGASDLLIAADGVNSLARKTHASVFRPTVEQGRAKYIWYGTDRVLDAFTFIFRENEHGFFQVHAYPFSGTTSTFIVECDEATWRRAGLDSADEATSIAYCEELFADDLRGRRLLSNNSKWINFATVSCRSWHHGTTVLLGDAAHTAHFSIGSGTKLAMEDAIVLANSIEQHGELETALSEYELERRPVVEAFQAAAAESRTYFEHVRRYRKLEPEQFTFHLLTRSGRISYDDLRLRDARFMARVDRWFARAAGVSTLVAPPPAFAPLALSGVTLANRVVLQGETAGCAREGEVAEEDVARLREAARAGAGLVLTTPVAVSAEGRITPGCAGMYRPEHAAAWERTVRLVRVEAPGSMKLGVQLGHAGRRGATRPRAEGLDRPLREGGWPLLAASALPYTTRSQVPRPMDREDLERVRKAFVQAARMAARAGFDLLQVHCAQGYLLASFLSPLTNQRTDEYGGSRENRMRYPLEVFDAVRAVWPDDRPLAAAIPGSDFAPGGLVVEDAVALAAALRARGCDLVTVLGGQTTPSAEPPYGRGFLTPLSDRVRTEADVRTLVGGYLTSIGEVNTILAAGRADLCQMEPQA